MVSALSMASLLKPLVKVSGSRTRSVTPCSGRDQVGRSSRGCRRDRASGWRPGRARSAGCMHPAQARDGDMSRSYGMVASMSLRRRSRGSRKRSMAASRVASFLAKHSRARRWPAGGDLVERRQRNRRHARARRSASGRRRRRQVADGRVVDQLEIAARHRQRLAAAWSAAARGNGRAWPGRTRRAARSARARPSIISANAHCAGANVQKVLYWCTLRNSALSAAGAMQ